MDTSLARWCQDHLGSPPVAEFFRVRRISTVHGLRLADGREVAVKVREAQPRQQACALVQRALFDAGIPCPEPLAGPEPLLHRQGIQQPDSPESADWPAARTLAVSAESWEGEGVAEVGPIGARGYARLLARMVAAAPAVSSLPTLEPSVPWLGWDHQSPDRTWAPAMSDRWDPHRIEPELPPFIIDVARRSRARLLQPDVALLPLVAGHGDFETQNCRWVPDGGSGQRLVIHDWDSIVAKPEAVLAGNSAFTYLSADDCDISSLEQNDEFLSGYEAARGRPWSALEWQVAHAAGAWVGAYNAAFEYLKGGPGPITRGLRSQAEQRLGRAAA